MGSVFGESAYVESERANHDANPKGSKEGRSMNEAQTLVLIHAVAWPILIWLLDFPSELKSTMNRGL